jgi:hypothetical protein
VAERRRAAPVRERLKAGFRFKLTKRKFMVSEDGVGLMCTTLVFNRPSWR